MNGAAMCCRGPRGHHDQDRQPRAPGELCEAWKEVAEVHDLLVNPHSSGHPNTLYSSAQAGRSMTAICGTV